MRVRQTTLSVRCLELARNKSLFCPAISEELCQDYNAKAFTEMWERDSRRKINRQSRNCKNLELCIRLVHHIRPGSIYRLFNRMALGMTRLQIVLEHSTAT
jgi:hypothetical protein